MTARRMTRAELDAAGPYPKEANLEGSDATGWQFAWYFGYNRDGSQHCIKRIDAEDGYQQLNDFVMRAACDEIMAAPAPPRTAFEMRLLERAEKESKRRMPLSSDDDEERISPRDPRRLPG